MKNITPFVSVIIPTRNRVQYLCRALESIQRQRYAHDKYEIIVVDNGSTDDTRQVVEALNRNGRKEICYIYDDRTALMGGDTVSNADISQPDYDRAGNSEGVPTK